MIAIQTTSTDAALRWVADNYGRLLAMCRSMAGRNVRIAEVLMDEVMDQSPRLVESWDAARGPLDAYMNWCLRRRLSQRLKRHALEQNREQLQSLIEAEGILPELLDSEAVSDALESVDGIEFYVVAARFWYGDSFEQIAADLNTYTSKVQRTYAAAIKRMQSSFRRKAESVVS